MHLNFKYMKKVAEKLRLLRQERGYSQQYVADSLGISVPTVSRIESTPAKMHLEYFYMLASFYEITLGKLFSDEEEEINEELAKFSMQITMPFPLQSRQLFLLAKRLEIIEKEKTTLCK